MLFYKKQFIVAAFSDCEHVNNVNLWTAFAQQLHYSLHFLYYSSAISNCNRWQTIDKNIEFEQFKLNPCKKKKMVYVALVCWLLKSTDLHLDFYQPKFGFLPTQIQEVNLLSFAALGLLERSDWIGCEKTN